MHTRIAADIAKRRANRNARYSSILDMQDLSSSGREQRLKHELRIQTENFKTKDFKEGVRSYRTKTKPEFSGL